MDFLEENSIETLNWPPQSPDMNPIENLCAIIKRRRQKKFGVPLTKNDLIEQIFAIWEDIDISLFTKLSDSITKRLNECIRLKDRPTKY